MSMKYDASYASMSYLLTDGSPVDFLGLPLFLVGAEADATPSTCAKGTCPCPVLGLTNPFFGIFNLAETLAAGMSYLVTLAVSVNESGSDAADC